MPPCPDAACLKTLEPRLATVGCQPLPCRLVKILVLTNLYPPHHAGTFDLRCESLVDERDILR